MQALRGCGGGRVGLRMPPRAASDGGRSRSGRLRAAGVRERRGV